MISTRSTYTSGPPPSSSSGGGTGNSPSLRVADEPRPRPNRRQPQDVYPAAEERPCPVDDLDAGDARDRPALGADADVVEHQVAEQAAADAPDAHRAPEGLRGEDGLDRVADVCAPDRRAAEDGDREDDAREQDGAGDGDAQELPHGQNAAPRLTLICQD